LKNDNLIPRKFIEAVRIKNKSFNEVQEAIADASENKGPLKDEASIFELNISLSYNNYIFYLYFMIIIILIGLLFKAFIFKYIYLNLLINLKCNIWEGI
jgi:hypothetical protein